MDSPLLLLLLTLIGSVLSIDCPSGKIDVTMNRVTKSWAYEEFFYVWNTPCSNDLQFADAVYQQPTVQDYSSYIWHVCLNPGLVCVVMVDNLYDGWTSGSTLSFSVGSTFIGTYSIAYYSGWNNVTIPNVLPPYGLQYSSSIYVLEKGDYFIERPTVEGESVQFSIASGSLPSGLTLSSWGSISGYPTAVTYSTVVTIKASNSFGSTTVTLTFMVYEVSVTCASSEKTLVMIRTTKSAAAQESFKLYEGTTSGTLKFTQPSVTDNAGFTWNICVNNTLHTLQLTDSGGNGWSEDSKLLLVVSESVIGTYTLESGGTSDQIIVIAKPSYLFYHGPFVMNVGTSFTTTPSSPGALLIYSVFEGELPPGLVLNQETGVISGTPTTAVFNQTVTIKVSNSLGFATTIVTFSVLNHPTSCQSGFLLTITRFAKLKVDEESFAIYRGTTTTGTPVFTQPPLRSYTTNTWTLCVENDVYTIQMTDSKNDGWVTNSNLDIHVSSTKIGTYSLESGNLDTETFVVSAPTSFSYPGSPFSLQKGSAVSISPSISGYVTSVTITSGSLPTGLSLNEQTGVISGTPTQVVTNKEVTIKGVNSLGSKTVTISFTVIDNVSSCSSSQVLVTLTRTTKTLSSQESFSIYQGTSTAGTLVYTQPYTLDNTVYTFKICLQKVAHVIHMTDSLSNGWQTGSNVVISISGKTVKTTRVVSGSSNTVLFPTVAPTSFLYPYSTFTIRVNDAFSIVPTYTGDDVTFSIYSSSLPSGLSLNTSTGEISGACSRTSYYDMSVAIKIENALGSRTVTLTFSVFSDSQTCSSGYVLTTFTRETKGNAAQENFIVSYSTSTNYAFEQPTIFDNQSYTWKRCLMKSSYSLQLSDLGGNGWSTGSTLVISVEGGTIGTYRLDSGASTTHAFSLQAPSYVNYNNGYFSIQKGFAFSYLPSHSYYTPTFTISSGTLPAGLTLNPQTGRISGTPTVVTTAAMDVGIKISNLFGDVTITVQFMVVEFKTTCSSNEELITITRKTTSCSYGNFYIYEGSSASGTAVFEQPTVSTYGDYVWKICLKKATHTIKLVDYHTGSACYYWGSDSAVTISIGETQLGVFYSGFMEVYTSTFSTVAVSGFSYEGSPFILLKDSSFSVSPTLSSSASSFSILSGTLPTGLSLDTTTGTLSGTPTVSVTNRSVTIKATNSLGSTNTTVVFTVFTNPTACPSSEVLVTIIRTTKENHNEEMFKIYEGVNTAGTVVFTQPFTKSYSSFTWKVCLKKTTHVLEMTDSVGDGWTQYSYVNLAVSSKSIGQFRLDLGSSTTTLFPTVGPSNLVYPGTPFIITKDVDFSITPTFQGANIAFSISSGSLPTGLTLDPNTGIISGLPTVLITNRSVGIKATNVLGSVTTLILFTVLENPTSCTGGKILVTVTRTTKSRISEEMFYIYQGASASGIALFTQPTLADSTSYTWRFCLSNTIHSIKMTDSNADGWYANSNIVITAQSVTLGTYRLSSGSTVTNQFSPAAPTNLVYSTTPFSMQKDTMFTVTPTYVGYVSLFTIFSGTLPYGLSLHPTTGTISGTATIVSSHNVTIKAENNVGFVTYSISLTVLAAPTYCVSTEVLTTLTRVTKTGSSEESFMIYEGTTATGTPKFTQLSVFNNYQQTWTVCLKKTAHTLRMTDSNNNGWTTASSLSITINEKVIGTYRLSSGTVVDIEFPTIPPTSINYADSPYIITRDVEFSLTPLFVGDTVTFSISTGSLPTGLTLNPYTGVISGTPVSAIIDRSVTIKISNAVGFLTQPLLFSVLVNPTSCVGDDILVTLVRLTKNNAAIENFRIYNGIGTSGPAEFIQPTLGDNKSYTWTVCLAMSLHTIYVDIDYGTSWRANSMLSVSIAEGFVGSCALTSGFPELYYLAFIAPTGLEYEDSPFTLAHGRAYVLTPEVLGILLTYEITTGTLPTGLSLNTTTGVISGIPTQVVSNSTLTIKVSNPFGHMSTTISFTVIIPPQSLSYPTNAIPKLQQVTIQPVYEGGPCTFSVVSGSLPSGLSIHSTTGVISGTPTSTSLARTIRVRAQNAVGSVEFSFTITPLLTPAQLTYNPALYNIPTNSLVDALPYTIVGDDLTFTVASGSLPTEIVLNPLTGRLYGLVTTSFPLTVATIKAANAIGFVTTDVSFKVTAPPVNFKYSANVFYSPINTPISITPTYSGDPCVFSISEGVLDSELTFNTNTGTISGTPTAHSINTLSIVATNDGGLAVFQVSVVILTIPSIQFSEVSYTTVRNEDFCISPTYKGELVAFRVDGHLPPNFAINDSTGEICGNSPETADTTFTVIIENMVGRAQTTVGIKVNLFSVVTWIVIVIVLVAIIVGIIFLIRFLTNDSKKMPVQEKPVVPKPLRRVQAVPKSGGGPVQVNVNMQLQTGAPGAPVPPIPQQVQQVTQGSVPLQVSSNVQGVLPPAQENQVVIGVNQGQPTQPPTMQPQQPIGTQPTTMTQPQQPIGTQPTQPTTMTQPITMNPQQPVITQPTVTTKPQQPITTPPMPPTARNQMELNQPTTTSQSVMRESEPIRIPAPPKQPIIVDVAPSSISPSIEPSPTVHRVAPPKMNPPTRPAPLSSKPRFIAPPRRPINRSNQI